MLIVPEKEIAALMSRKDAFEAVEGVFASMARRDAYNFPVVRAAIGHADALYGFKSGFDRAALTLGLKSGGYWPGNAARGLTNHQSAIFLFDADTGRPAAMVGGNLLTALRTAASAAVSVAHLARADATVLGIVGAGHQAAFQLRAALEQRDFERVIAWILHPEMLPRLGAVAEEAGLPFEAVDLPGMVAADVIITITASHAASRLAEHVSPGTHIACMGTDTAGKQEVSAELLTKARVFCDERAQSTSIGEAQHAVAQGLIEADAITELGAVINGTAPGRVAADDITLFDGTGVGLQDLAVADAVLQGAIAASIAGEVDG